MHRRKHAIDPNGRRALWALCLLLGVAAGCSQAVNLDESSARDEIDKNFPGWKIVTAKDLQSDDFSAWSAAHPGAAPGFATGDYFGDGRKAYAALLTREDPELGRRTRVVVLGLTPSGRFETYPIFSESPVEELPAIFTSKAGEYQVFIDERAVPVPVEGVVYAHPGVSQKLFFWTGSKFQDVELGPEG